MKRVSYLPTLIFFGMLEETQAFIFFRPKAYLICYDSIFFFIFFIKNNMSQAPVL